MNYKELFCTDEVFAVGVGPDITTEGLTQVAGSAKRVLKIKSFEELGKKMNSLLKSVCKTVGER